MNNINKYTKGSNYKAVTTRRKTKKKRYDINNNAMYKSVK